MIDYFYNLKFLNIEKYIFNIDKDKIILTILKKKNIMNNYKKVQLLKFI